MELETLKEVQNCLCGERTLYHYYPDKYALDILARNIRRKGSVNVRDLKASNLAPLLNRPAVREVLAKSGKGQLASDTIYCGYQHTEPYVLTIGSWGEVKQSTWMQTSRPGKNLVLQLNLSKDWSDRFKRFAAESANSFFGSGHPLSKQRDITLAWARLDLDFDTDEVLIEEVQSDLIRDAKWMLRRAEFAQKRKRSTFHCYGHKMETDKVTVFCNALIKQFDKYWQEAILAASLDLCFDEIGVSNVFYHSFETGIKLKNIGGRKPPISLYTELPKRFCFQTTCDVPQFLQSEKRVKRKLKAIKDKRFFHMVV